MLFLKKEELFTVNSKRLVSYDVFDFPRTVLIILIAAYTII